MSSMPPAQLVQHLSAELSPMLAVAGFELVDVEFESAGGLVVRILVDLAEISDGPFGRIDLEGVSQATRLIDTHLDAADPIEQAFTLEVSSPGLERPLRTPAHFARFIGTEIAVKTVVGTPGERRIAGTLIEADPDAEGGFAVASRAGEQRIAYSSIDRARTVFRWGEEIGPGETASGQPRKKGALPKGQRPLHPKSAQAEAGALASRSPQIDKQLSTGRLARTTEPENPEVTS